MTELGSVLGLAYGDSMGKEVEFTRYPELRRKFRGLVPARLAAGGRVTDDTQMMLAVGEALVQVRRKAARVARNRRQNRTVRIRPADVEAALIGRFINWYEDPENNRAPGMTCLRACGALAAGVPWWEAADKNSKGCGANMRVTVVGLCDWLSYEERSAIAQFQAALTHAHPTALAAADATQRAVWLLNHDTAPEKLLNELEAYCLDRMTVWHRDWLGELWRWTRRDNSASEYLSRGWEEVWRALKRVRAALAAGDDGGDVCEWAGEAWSADEALSAALLTFLWHSEDPVTALRRGATSNGDSDSIAAIAGAFAGAYWSEYSLPAPWRRKVEYRARLEAMAHGLR